MGKGTGRTSPLYLLAPHFLDCVSSVLLTNRQEERAEVSVEESAARLLCSMIPLRELEKDMDQKDRRISQKIEDCLIQVSAILPFLTTHSQAILISGMGQWVFADVSKERKGKEGYDPSIFTILLAMLGKQNEIGLEGVRVTTRVFKTLAMIASSASMRPTQEGSERNQASKWYISVGIQVTGTLIYLLRREWKMAHSTSEGS